MQYALFIYKYTCSVTNFLVTLLCIHVTAELEAWVYLTCGRMVSLLLIFQRNLSISEKDNKSVEWCAHTEQKYVSIPLWYLGF